MSNSLLNVGLDNMVSTAEIVAIARPDSLPIKQMISAADEDNHLIDLTRAQAALGDRDQIGLRGPVAAADADAGRTLCGGLGGISDGYERLGPTDDPRGPARPPSV